MTVETKILLKNSLDKFQKSNKQEQKTMINHVKNELVRVKDVPEYFEKQITAAAIFLRIYKNTDLCKN